MNILMDVAANPTANFPVEFVAVYVVGFIAAVTIGSIAWYNSKRPPGWENADRPNIIPDLKTDDTQQKDSE